MKFIFHIFTVIFLTCCFVTSYYVPRGTQVRLTQRGMNYAASVGIRRLERDLRNKRLPSQNGNVAGVTFSAFNLMIQYLRIGNYRVTPLANSGFRFSMTGVSVGGSGRLRVGVKVGWVHISDTNNVNIKGSNIAFSLDFRFDARNGKPHVQATSCSSSIGHLNLHFSGPLGFAYNAITGLFSGQLKGIIKDMVCTHGIGLINKEANNFFSKFPVQQNIENIAILDYSFQRPVVTSSYLDLLLRGEFLNPKNPKHGSETPPAFNTITSSSKMVYVWLSDYTMNSAGKVMHQTGLLKKLVRPLMDGIPTELKPFMNTRSFEQMIPELYHQYPNCSLEFQLLTKTPPMFVTKTGKINVQLDVRATISVEKDDGTTIPVFYLDLNVDTSGSAFLTSINRQLKLGGKIIDFTFGVKIGGSTLGEFKIPFNDPSIKQLVHGLVVANANCKITSTFLDHFMEQ